MNGNTWATMLSIIAVAPAFPPSFCAAQTTATTGPDGSRIDIVKQMNIFDLDGSGVRVGQFESGLPLVSHVAFQDGQGGSRITRHTPSPPISNHATGVAGILIGGPWTPASGQPRLGVAHAAELWSSNALGNALYYDRIDWLVSNDVHVLNMSRRIAGFPPTTGDEAPTLFADMIAREEDVLWVQAAGNSGPMGPSITAPGDAYNILTVGSLDRAGSGLRPNDFNKISDFSSRGPTADGRHKPDIVAPGQRIPMAGVFSNNGTYTDSGTSFAAPHVAGLGTLLHQHAMRGSLPTGHLLKKVAILNGASKHVTDPRRGNRAWVQTPAATSAAIPLDDAMGVGRVNGLAAVRNYQSADRSDVALRGGSIDAAATRVFDLSGGQELKRGSLVTATLTWDRPVDLAFLGDRTNKNDYTGKVLPDLDLELVRLTSGGSPQIFTGSVSTRDSVEHIYVNVPQDGKYQLRVKNRSNTDVEDLGLAWSSGTSDGLAFSVDGGHFNNGRPAATRNPAEGQMGDNPFPNDVNALGPVGPANFPSEGEVFVSSRDGTNMQRLSGALGTRSRVGPHNAPPAAMALLNSTERGVLGLVPNDNIVGLSWGTDGTRLEDSTIVFSVDPAARGNGGSDVHYHAVESPSGFEPDRPFPDNPGGGEPGVGGSEAAGDVYVTPRLDRFGAYKSPRLAPAPSNSNRLFIDEIDLGLQAPKRNGDLHIVAEDDLDALEMDNPLLTVDPNGNGLHDQPVFFNLDRFSPSISGAVTPDDILVSTSPFSYSVFADGVADIHLRLGDAIDALILSDFGAGFAPDGRLGSGDEALFSLDPMSPSGSPGDIYYTDFVRPFRPTLPWEIGGSLFASASEIGLLTVLGNDNLNALDIYRIPSPGALALLVVGSAVLTRHRRTGQV